MNRLLYTFHVLPHEHVINKPRAWVMPEIWNKVFILQCCRVLHKIPDPDPDVDDFSNLTVSSLSTDASVVRFWWRSSQQFLRAVANRQTDRQTNAGYDNLLDGDNQMSFTSPQQHGRPYNKLQKDTAETVLLLLAVPGLFRGIKTSCKKQNVLLLKL